MNKPPIHIMSKTPLSYGSTSISIGFRLEVNLSNLESENQVIRQQEFAASSNEELTEEVEM